MRSWALVLVVLLGSGCASEVAFVDPPPGPDPLVVLDERCTGCHGLDWVCGLSRSRDEWRRVLDRMRGYGARFSEAEESALAEWLTEPGALAGECAR